MKFFIVETDIIPAYNKKEALKLFWYENPEFNKYEDLHVTNCDKTRKIWVDLDNLMENHRNAKGPTILKDSKLCVLLTLEEYYMYRLNDDTILAKTYEILPDWAISHFGSKSA